MSQSTVQITCSGQVTKILLNRPDKLNALSGALLRELHSALRAAADDQNCRCVILSGVGRGFSAGADLTDIEIAPKPGQTLDLGAALHSTYHPIVRLIREMPKPVIAAINGIAAGAGCNIGLAADVVIAARSARFIQAFIKIGLVPDAGGTWTIPRLIGRARAMQWMMSGDTLDAETALQWGLVTALHDDEALADAADALAAKMAGQPTVALAKIKQLIDQSTEQDLEAQLHLEARMQTAMGTTADAMEGIGAFVQKREARFLGR